jgi:predicted DNA-binding protein (MmcQ/YjbR family)
MANDLDRAVQQLCLAFPASEALRSHGSANFRVRGGKIFATYAINHHGDGRIALWLNVPSGVQDGYVRQEPVHFFVPAYVGPSGWLGVRLDKGLAWRRVCALVRMAYERVAPPALRQELRTTPQIPAPKARVHVADVDPKNSPRGKRVLAVMRKICLALPETSDALQFGQPVWRCGARVFAQAYCYDGVWRVAFWVGVAAQGMMLSDRRYQIPQYLGHLGWIALDVSKSLNERELRPLALASYRHFALKRMLKML